MELRDTVTMMNSPDYRERFRAEYAQMVIRYRKLDAMLKKWDEGNLDFTPHLSEKHLQYADFLHDGVHCRLGGESGYGGR